MDLHWLRKTIEVGSWRLSFSLQFRVFHLNSIAFAAWSLFINLLISIRDVVIKEERSPAWQEKADSAPMRPISKFYIGSGMLQGQLDFLKRRNDFETPQCNFFKVTCGRIGPDPFSTNSTMQKDNVFGIEEIGNVLMELNSFYRHATASSTDRSYSLPAMHICTLYFDILSQVRRLPHEAFLQAALSLHGKWYEEALLNQNAQKQVIELRRTSWDLMNYFLRQNRKLVMMSGMQLLN